MPIVTKTEWDGFFCNYWGAHFMQSSAWGEVKSLNGWYDPVFFITNTSGAQLLFPRLPLGLRIAYIPKGPVGQNWSILWDEIDQYCKEKGVIFLKVEPDANEPMDNLLVNEMDGFMPDCEPLQPRRTIIVDLDGNEDSWLARMKRNTRYNIGLGRRRGLELSLTSDVENFSRIMETTAKRDGFQARSKEGYQKSFEAFANSRNYCRLTQGVMIRVDFHQTPLAGVFVTAHGKRAWSLYAGTTNEYRDLKPSYLMYFEVMRWAASQGCEQLDLFGIPDFDKENLETNFNHRSDELWGVYGFKRGFGGTVTRHVCSWDRVYNPFMYFLYRQFIRLTGVYNRM